MKSRKAYSAFSKPAGRGRRRREWGVQLLNIWRDCLRRASVSGVVQGHQLGSLLFGTTALVFLMPMYANRTLVMAQEETICSRQGRRQSLQTVTRSLKHRIKTVVSVLVLESCTMWVPKIQPVCALWSHHHRHALSQRCLPAQPWWRSWTPYSYKCYLISLQMTASHYF